MTTNVVRSITAAAAVTLLAGSAGGALAQTSAPPRDVPPSVSLGYSASPLDGQGAAGWGPGRSQRALTVMGMTGGIEPKDVDATGSIVGAPPVRRAR